MFEECKKVKDMATEKFKAKEFKEASDLYLDGVARVGELSYQTPENKKFKQICYQNAAICMNKLGEAGEREYYFKAVVNCTSALEIDEDSEKALYNRAVANMNVKNWAEALEDIKDAIKLNANNKVYRDLYEKIKAGKKEADSKDKNIYANIFSGEGLYEEKEAPKANNEFDVLPAFDPDNAQCFFDIKIGDPAPGASGEEPKRVVFEVFTKQVPKTAENFRSICAGDNDKGYHYKGNFFHRVIKGFMAQGGDITNQNGTGGMSIYGEKFADEQIWIPHTHKGVLSMANAGPDTNGSQFFICFGPTPHLNGKHTIFGRVISNYDIIREMESSETAAQDLPIKQVTIVDCGELKGDDKLTADTADFLTNYDMDDTDSPDEEEEQEPDDGEDAVQEAMKEEDKKGDDE